MQSLRIGDFQGVRYNIQSHSDDFEIYNVVSDPQETHNLAGDKKIAALQQQMKNSVLQLRRPDSNAPRPYDNELIPAISVSATAPGVEWSAYKDKFPWVPELTALSPTSRGITKSPTLTIRPRDKNIGLLFTGYLSAPADGDYTIYLTADSGALLRIHEATVIDEDFGYIGGTEKSGAIKLKKGLHPFRFYYARGTKGKPAMKLEWSGPGIEKQSIPDAAFSNDGILSNK